VDWLEKSNRVNKALSAFSVPLWWIGLKNPTESTKPYLLLVCRFGGSA